MIQDALQSGIHAVLTGTEKMFQGNYHAKI